MAGTFSIIPEQYQSFVVDAVLWARQQLETGEKLKAVFYIGNSEKQTVIRSFVDTSTEESRVKSANAARTIAAIEQADFVLNISEVWALPTKDMLRYQEILEKHGSLAAYKGRVDSVSFQLETYEGIFGAIEPIKPKPPSKKRRTFAEPRFFKADGAEGRLANILPVRTPPTVH